MKKLLSSIIFALSLAFVTQSGFCAGSAVSKLTVRPGAVYSSTQPYISSATISFVHTNCISTPTMPLAASTQQIVMADIRDYNFNVSFPTNNIYNLGFFTRTSTDAALTEKMAIKNTGAVNFAQTPTLNGTEIISSTYAALAGYGLFFGTITVPAVSTVTISVVPAGFTLAAFPMVSEWKNDGSTVTLAIYDWQVGWSSFSVQNVGYTARNGIWQCLVK